MLHKQESCSIRLVSVVRRVLDDHEKMSSELELKKRKLDVCGKELNKCEASSERKRQKLDEKKKVIFCSNCMLMEDKLP